MSVNEPLTRLFRGLNRQTSAAARRDECRRAWTSRFTTAWPRRKWTASRSLVAFVAGVQTMAINGGIWGSSWIVSVTLRGWCAEPGQFVMDTPVLEKVCASMQLTPAVHAEDRQGNEQAADKIRETYAYMNKVDDQIRQSRWDTMDAIAEMNYDTLRDTGGYVNEKTGRIEQIRTGEAREEQPRRVLFRGRRSSGA